MIVSSPFSTVGTLPETGASRNAAPLAATASPTAGASVGRDRAHLQHDVLGAGRARGPLRRRGTSPARPRRPRGCSARRRRRRRPPRRGRCRRRAVRLRDGVGPLAGPVPHRDVEAWPGGASRPSPRPCSRRRGRRRVASCEGPASVDPDLAPVHRRVLEEEHGRVGDVAHRARGVPVGVFAFVASRASVFGAQNGLSATIPGCSAFTRIGASSAAMRPDEPVDPVVDRGDRRRTGVRAELREAAEEQDRRIGREPREQRRGSTSV